MSKISVITITYKHKDFIGHTIESILGQTFSDWEMLIGDDSPDNESWQVIQHYVKQYPDKIKARHHTPNKGIVNNMNFLISQANKDSQYIALLEGDDMYTPNNLEEKLKIFDIYKDVALVYNNLDLINSNNKVFLKNFFGTKKIKFYKNTTIAKDEYIYHKTGPICSFSTVMIKKSVFDNIKLINPINTDKAYTNPDFDFYFKICQQYNIYGIQDSLTLYRRHIGNLSGAHLKPFTDLEQLIEYYGKQHILSPALAAYKISWLNILKAIGCMYLKDRKNGFKYFYLSFKTSFGSHMLYKFGFVSLFFLPNFLLNILLKKMKID